MRASRAAHQVTRDWPKHSLRAHSPQHAHSEQHMASHMRARSSVSPRREDLYLACAAKASGGGSSDGAANAESPQKISPGRFSTLPNDLHVYPTLLDAVRRAAVIGSGGGAPPIVVVRPCFVCCCECGCVFSMRQGRAGGVGVGAGIGEGTLGLDASASTRAHRPSVAPAALGRGAGQRASHPALSRSVSAHRQNKTHGPESPLTCLYVSSIHLSTPPEQSSKRTL